MQVLQHKPCIILDVAHNPHSAAYLVEQIQLKYSNRRVRTVVAMLHDKDIQATLDTLSSVADEWYPASLNGPRAANADELCQFLPDNVKTFSTPTHAFTTALEDAEANDVILVVGSFLTVGEVLEYWKSRGE